MLTDGKKRPEEQPQSQNGESNQNYTERPEIDPADAEAKKVESDGEVARITLAPWYAVRVRPNYEKPVAAALHGKGFQEFLPLIRSKRQWSDRVKIMDLPLFP